MNNMDELLCAEVEKYCKECKSLEDALCSIAIWECDRAFAAVCETGIYSTRMATAFDTMRKEWVKLYHSAGWVFTAGGS